MCAGTEQLFSLEDALCAGYLAKILQGENREVELSDAAQAAVMLYNQAKDDFLGAVKNSKNGKRLYNLNKDSDVENCIKKNLVTVVPRYCNKCIRL